MPGRAENALEHGGLSGVNAPPAHPNSQQPGPATAEPVPMNGHMNGGVPGTGPTDRAAPTDPVDPTRPD